MVDLYKNIHCSIIWNRRHFVYVNFYLTHFRFCAVIMQNVWAHCNRHHAAMVTKTTTNQWKWSCLRTTVAQLFNDALSRIRLLLYFCVEANLSIIWDTCDSCDAKCEVGQLTDDEHGNDDHQDQRHVLAVSRPTTRRRRRDLLMSTTRGMQRSDEKHVENEQRHERANWTKHQVAAGLVDDVVDLVVSQRCLHHLGVTLHKHSRPLRAVD